MNNIREKFEAWLVQEIGEHAENNDKDMIKYLNRNVDTIYHGWQVSTEQSQKEIAEKDARIAELERNVEKLTNANETWLEWRDEQVKQLEALQAREKVLVEAISSSLNCIREEINLNNYTETLLGDFISDYGDMVIILRQALATVRGE